MSISIRDMFESGVHYGHQTRYWNPKMRQYIFGERNGIHLINLDKTYPMFKDVLNFIGQVVSKKGRILFVGTKKAACDVIQEQAERANMPYVNHRWLGGMLTNYTTVRQSVKRLIDLEKQQEEGVFDNMIKKEALKLSRQMEKLQRSFNGIKNMKGLPDALVVIDSNFEDIAIKEAQCLGIPVIAIVDTNCNPDGIDYVIPGNDDAIRAIRLYLTSMVDAILDAKQSIQEENFDEAPVSKKTKKAEPKKVVKVQTKSTATQEATERTLEVKEEAKKPAAKKPAAKKATKAPAAKKTEAKKASDAKKISESSASKEQEAKAE